MRSVLGMEASVESVHLGGTQAGPERPRLFYLNKYLTADLLPWSYRTVRF